MLEKLGIDIDTLGWIIAVLEYLLAAGCLMWSLCRAAGKDNREERPPYTTDEKIFGRRERSDGTERDD